MKKSLLALAVAAVAASSVASAATVYDKDGTSLAVYGRMQAVVYSGHATNKIGNDYQDTGLQGSGRLGLDMRTQLTDGIAAFAKAEWDVADNGERDGSGKGGNDSFASRYLWVGVDFGQFGQVKFGRFEDAVKYVLLPTDISYADDFDCQGQMDNDDKRDGNIMYTWNGYGFTVNLNYQTAKDSQQVDGAWAVNEKLDIDNAYGISVGYQSPDVLFGPIGIRLGYAGAQFQDDAAAASDI
ncbi:porin [Succinatimonas hippei]|uniref:porin n=1 Tax=Succinatimonas hippei TaxID=626938 RepID=UPI0024938112|nr:porin [Succinatimonas hippei]